MNEYHPSSKQDDLGSIQEELSGLKSSRSAMTSSLQERIQRLTEEMNS